MRSFVAILCFLVVPVLAQDRKNDSEVIQSPDFATSLRELRQLAEQGQPVAQYNLGIIYEYGRGVGRSDAEAVKWYRQASVQGVSVAQYRLAIMYDNGWGVPPNDTEAVKWYREAAEQGNPFAQHDLAFMYAAGTGVAQDFVRAYMWLNVAVASGNSLMVKHQNSIAGKLTPAQVEEAEKMARKWMENHRK